MDSESFGDSLNTKNCKCCDCDCECGCSERSNNWIRSGKRKHNEFEKAKNLNSGDGGHGVVRVEIGDECVALREAVSSQQKAIQDLYSELEEERNAASSAANETMSMILRLQTEKAELEMEARQFKRFVEEKTSHDQQELLALEELLYKKEQAIHSLTCEVQAYKHRLLSYGFTESEVEGDYEFPPYEYPPLKCNVMHTVTDVDNDDFDVDVEKYVFGETPRDRLRSLENRISQMERTPTYSQMDGEFNGKNIIEKVIVGQSPRRNKHSRKFSCDSSLFGPEFVPDSPRLNGSFRKMDNNGSGDFSNFKKMDILSEAGDNMTDIIYTVDSEFKDGAGGYDEYETTPMEFGDQSDFEDPYVKKLYMRLQALEADRESMRQAIISMRTDKAQLVLLKEIAQHLCKEMSEQRKVTVRSFIGGLSFFTIFKWIASIVFWRKRGHQIKYMFGLPSTNAGLLMLLDKGSGVRSWRYVSRTEL